MMTEVVAALIWDKAKFIFFQRPAHKVLGSLWAFLLMLISYPPIIIWRIFDEEKTLADGLPGYREYMSTVKYRLIPRVW